MTNILFCEWWTSCVWTSSRWATALGQSQACNMLSDFKEWTLLLYPQSDAPAVRSSGNKGKASSVFLYIMIMIFKKKRMGLQSLWCHFTRSESMFADICHVTTPWSVQDLCSIYLETIYGHGRMLDPAFQKLTSCWWLTIKFGWPVSITSFLTVITRNYHF